MRGRRGHDRMVVGYTTACAISAYHLLSCGSDPVHGEVYLIHHYVIKWFAAGRWFSSGPPISSTNKTDRHDIAENIVESGVKHHKPSQKNISVHCYIRNQTDLKTSYQTSFISKLKYSNWKGTSCIQNCNWNRNTLHCLKQNVGLKLFILRARCSTAYRFDGFALQY